MIKLSLQELQEKNANFGVKFEQALKDGFFYFEIPKAMKEKIATVSNFAANIRNNDALKTYKFENPRLGYQVREGTQAISFLAMSYDWKRIYPNDVLDIAIAMNGLALDILKASLQQLSIPKGMWDQATGGLTNNEGSNVFTINHYKSKHDDNSIGLIPHKDMGWITVLFIDKLGLETSIDGKNWTSIPPKEGYFVVNFGRAFELFINNENLLKASLHRVSTIIGERQVFGIFVNQKEGAPIHQIDIKGDLIETGNYQEYLNKCFAEFQAVQEAQKMAIGLIPSSTETETSEPVNVIGTRTEPLDDLKLIQNT